MELRKLLNFGFKTEASLEWKGLIGNNFEIMKKRICEEEVRGIEGDFWVARSQGLSIRIKRTLSQVVLDIPPMACSHSHTHCPSIPHTDLKWPIYWYIKFPQDYCGLSIGIISHSSFDSQVLT